MPSSIADRPRTWSASVVAMAIFAGLIGVLSNAFASVLDEFADPKSDPMALFREAHRENQQIRQLEEEYRK